MQGCWGWPLPVALARPALGTTVEGPVGGVAPSRTPPPSALHGVAGAGQLGLEDGDPNIVPGCRGGADAPLGPGPPDGDPRHLQMVHREVPPALGDPEHTAGGRNLYWQWHGHPAGSVRCLYLLVSLTSLGEG